MPCERTERSAGRDEVRRAPSTHLRSPEPRSAHSRGSGPTSLLKSRPHALSRKSHTGPNNKKTVFHAHRRLASNAIRSEWLSLKRNHVGGPAGTWSRKESKSNSVLAKSLPPAPLLFKAFLWGPRADPALRPAAFPLSSKPPGFKLCIFHINLHLTHRLLCSKSYSTPARSPRGLLPKTP